MALRKTLPRSKWTPFHFWRLGRKKKSKTGSSISPKYPSGLSLLWKSSTHEKSAVGPDPQYTGSPVVDAAGVAPGHGPTFADISALNTNGTLSVKFTATKNSADIVGEEHIFGPIYADANGLICSDGTNKARFATSWNSGDVMRVVVHVLDEKMRVGVE